MKQKHLISMVSKLLEMAGENFSNHGCNDLSEDFYDGMKKEDIQQLYKEWHKWNGDSEDYDPNQLGYLGDDCLMNYFSEQILENFDSTRWKCIKTAPQDGTHLLLYRPTIQFVGYYGGHNSGWRINAPKLPSMWPLPTHWKSLSDGPEK